ncbi:MAG TPA: UDP-N-acetylmuramate--L-alanine ligase [Candidatus Paceibacterota bacterium]|nr:UDP-N-acetylmuramate--L-alanine ligase [Candidatus Paceibacterota bacterium]
MKHTKNQYPPAQTPSCGELVEPFSFIEPKSVHLIGIFGIGVSSLAQWFSAQKWSVSGSDAVLSPIPAELKKAGVKAKIGHKKANIPARCGLIIYSNAIGSDNAEIREARRRNIPVLSYSEAVGELTKFYKTICVSGMHGKSTTTALVGLMLIKAGLDPTIIIGTRLKELGGKNFRAGKSEYLVLEADEYKDAFLEYSPAFAITTNLDREHLDYFKNESNVKKSFLKFFSGIRNGGGLILNADNEMLRSLKQKIDEASKINGTKVKWYSLRNKEALKIKKYIKLSGRHNISNALAVFCLSKFLGIREKVFLSTILGYNGSWRRMEYRGNFRITNLKLRIPIYDDYAHHPTEIKATLQAFREKFPNRRIICVFQPHQAERLKLLFKEFKNAFADADTAVILPIYRVRGRESSAASKFDSESLVKAMQKAEPHRQIFYLKELKNLKKALDVLLSDKSFPCRVKAQKSALNPRLRQGYGGQARKSAVVIMMGAGDIVNYTDTLLKVHEVESS